MTSTQPCHEPHSACRGSSTWADVFDSLNAALGQGENGGKASSGVRRLRLDGAVDGSWLVLYLVFASLVDRRSDEGDGEKIQIFVETATGKTITLDVSSDDHIKLVKEKILDREGVALDTQYLVFAGQQLEEGGTLSAYGIRRWDTIRVQTRMLGGASKGSSMQFGFRWPRQRHRSPKSVPRLRPASKVQQQWSDGGSGDSSPDTSAMDARSVFVGGVPKHWGTAQLEDLGKKFGRVKYCQIFFNEHRESRGCGKISYHTAVHQQAALVGIDDMQIGHNGRWTLRARPFSGATRRASMHAQALEQVYGTLKGVLAAMDADDMARSSSNRADHAGSCSAIGSIMQKISEAVRAHQPEGQAFIVRFPPGWADPRSVPLFVKPDMQHRHGNASLAEGAIVRGELRDGWLRMLDSNEAQWVPECDIRGRRVLAPYDHCAQPLAEIRLQILSRFQARDSIQLKESEKLASLRAEVEDAITKVAEIDAQGLRGEYIAAAEKQRVEDLHVAEQRQKRSIRMELEAEYKQKLQLEILRMRTEGAAKGETTPERTVLQDDWAFEHAPTKQVENDNRSDHPDEPEQADEAGDPTDRLAAAEAFQITVFVGCPPGWLTVPMAVRSDNSVLELKEELVEAMRVRDARLPC